MLKLYSYVSPWIYNSTKEAQVPVQSHENTFHISAEFVDDYRLLVSPGQLKGDPPCVVLIDTEKDVGGLPAQTSFQLPWCLHDTVYPSLLSERGVHKPSPAEHLAPFYQDPAQRVATFSTQDLFRYLVFPVEVLVGLAKGREGHEMSMIVQLTFGRLVGLSLRLMSPQYSWGSHNVFSLLS